MKNLSILLLTLSLISGCVGVQSKSMLIEEGMTLQEVVTILGTPDDKSFYNGVTIYQWCTSGEGLGWNGHVAIGLVDKKVKFSFSYRTGVTGCMNGMKSTAEVYNIFNM